MSSQIVVFKVTGLRPLLMNNPVSMSRGGKTVGAPKIPTPEKEAATKVYRTDGGQLYFPAVGFRSCIIGRGGAASGRKIGKRTANACVAASVFVVEEKFLLDHPETGEPITDYEIYTCRAVIQGNGILRSRPLIREWGGKLPLEVDEDFLTLNQLEELLNIGGKVAGIGDFRPGCKGSFGQFQVELVG